LGGVDGGGVAEAGRGANVVGGESDDQPAAVVPHVQVAVPADMNDGPAVAVLDPVGGGQAETSVVGAGDDHVADTGPVLVRQLDLSPRRGIAETMITGPAVEVGDECAGGGEHDRVQPGGPVGNPRGEDIIGCLGEIADVYPAVIKVEREGARVTVA
jgi:hypothetical protein